MKCESVEIQLIAKNPVEMLPVVESFYSIQGEGYHQGKAAYFIRLAGCDVGCHWCDVKESWDESSHPVLSVNQLIDDFINHNPRIVIVTGGEPTLHNLTYLCNRIRQKSIGLHLETSGTNTLTGQWDWICFSPKKFKKPLGEYYIRADELKVIVYNESDLEWAESHAARVNPECKLYLQPEWSRESKVKSMIIEYIKTNPKWGISLQIHKYLNVP
ncbi:MAG: 7-carboxy-7-deazaguanine synthase QueE [Bacteroidetes bacterium]|nr:7-carboxy-7-deazaguanine synthase QueE [Bacteroidota bacterium]